jgi:hypothetical protein
LIDAGRLSARIAHGGDGIPAQIQKGRHEVREGLVQAHLTSVDEGMSGSSTTQNNEPRIELGSREFGVDCRRNHRERLGAARLVSHDLTPACIGAGDRRFVRR